jgi:hypothetical protein
LDAVVYKDAIFATLDESFLAHLGEELWELWLRYATEFLKIADTHFSFREFTEDEKSFWMSEELENLCYFGGFLFEFIHIMKM